MDISHFQLFLYVFTFVAAVGLGLLFVKQKGPGVADADTPSTSAQRVLGENHEDMLRLRWVYADAIWRDDAATLDDLREAVTTLEDTERIARRVFGGAHPAVEQIEGSLQGSRAAYDARVGDDRTSTR